MYITAVINSVRQNVYPTSDSSDKSVILSKHIVIDYVLIDTTEDIQILIKTFVCYFVDPATYFLLKCTLKIL